MDARTDAPPPAIQAAMDALLISHGAYIPVELLITLGRLRYADYEAWRCGELPTLQRALAGNAGRVLSLLESAARWAGRLGLEPEPQTYFGWGANAAARLAFLESEWQGSEPLFATHYVRAAPAHTEAAQFDLFLDSGATAALADLRAALRARDAAGAARALEALAVREPAHRLRPAAERLTDALARLAAPVPAGAAEAELRAIEQSLLPAAREVLGPDARDLLAPFWQRLAAALAEAPFDADRPRLHASYAYARALDWRRARAAVEAVPGYDEEPALLERLAEARRRESDRNGAVAVWCMLCWRAPAAANECLGSADLPDAAVRRAWRRFLDIDVEPEPEASFFPAYLLLAEPGLARSLPDELGYARPPASIAEPGPAAFAAMRALLQSDETAARRALHGAAPWLLGEYLRVRAAGQWSGRGPAALPTTPSSPTRSASCTAR